MQIEDIPPVSLVVVGKNESKNLDDTFNAIEKIDYPKDKIEIIYVDSNSNDNSIEIAKKYCNRIIPIKSNWATSGLARNMGMLEANQEIIHFIDGDISISRDYLKEAIQKIIQNKADAVTGYFKEKNPQKFFNRIMNIRRDDILYQEHFCDSTNGGGTYVKSKLLSINGYDERILKGQESELGIRFRKDGNKILFINEVQGLHNFDLNSTWDFIKYKYILGKSYGYMLKIKKDLNEYINQSKKVSQKTLIVNSLSILIIFLSTLIGSWVILLLWFSVRVGSIFLKIKLFRKQNNRVLYHSFINYLFTFFTFLGIISVLFNPSLNPSGKEVYS